jgi:predicted Zn-dependent peptidase
MNRDFVKDLTEKELESVRNYVLGRILIDSQTNSKQAWYACFFENAGLGSEYFENYINVLKGITLEDVVKAAKIFDSHKTVYILK